MVIIKGTNHQTSSVLEEFQYIFCVLMISTPNLIMKIYLKLLAQLLNPAVYTVNKLIFTSTG